MTSERVVFGQSAAEFPLGRPPPPFSREWRRRRLENKRPCHPKPTTSSALAPSRDEQNSAYLPSGAVDGADSF